MIITLQHCSGLECLLGRTTRPTPTIRLIPQMGLILSTFGPNSVIGRQCDLTFCEVLFNVTSQATKLNSNILLHLTRS